MPAETSSLISVETIDYTTPGYSKFVTTFPLQTVPTLSVTAATKQSFYLMNSTKNLFSTRLTAFITSGAGAATYPAMHLGNLSMFGPVKLFTSQTGQVLYDQQNVNVLTKARNRAKVPFSDALNRGKILPIYNAAAAPTQAQLSQFGSRGSMLHLASGSVLAPLPLQSMPTYAILAAGGPMLQTLACPQPVCNVCLAWSNEAGAVPAAAAADGVIAYQIDIPLRDLGGVFAINKYLPYATQLQLDVSFLPLTQWTFRTTNSVLAVNTPTAVAYNITGLALMIDTASDEINADAMRNLASADIVLPCGFITEAIKNGPVGALQIVQNVPISGFMGSKLRCVYSIVVETTQAGVAAFNADNVNGLKWSSYVSTWNTKQLQDSPVNYYDAYNYLAPTLFNGLYQSGRDYLSNPVIVDNFTGVDLHDYSNEYKDIGVEIANTNNTYLLTLARALGAAEAVNVFTYVESQKDLVLTKENCYIAG